MKRMSRQKGKAGYIALAKKQRLIIALIMLAIPLTIFFTAKAYVGTNRNVFSIVAALGCIPAAKCIVDFIMIAMQKDAPEEIIRITEKEAGDLPRAYELVVTAYEGRMPLDALVVCGNNAIAHTTYGKREQIGQMEKHISKILTGNGYSPVNVHIFSEKKAYAERVRQLASNPEIHRSGIKFKPDSRYPDLTRDECILHTIMAISL